MSPEQMPAWGIGQRVSTNTRHWKEWKGNNNAINKPTLLVVGGIKTRSGRAANGNVKLFRNSIEKDVQVLGLYYEPLDAEKYPEEGLEDWGTYVAGELMQRGQFRLFEEDRMFLNGRQEWEISELPYPYANWFFDTYVIPMLKDRNKQTLSPEKAMKSMRNLNIATYCWGDFFTDKLSKIMKERLPQMGYSEAETADIMKQVCVLNLTGSLPAERDSGFTTLRVFSICDHTVSMMHWGTYNKFLCDTYWGKPGNRISLAQINSNESVLTVQHVLRPRTDEVTGGEFYHPDDFGAEHKYAIYADLDYKSTEGFVMYFMWRNFVDQMIHNSRRNARSSRFIPLPEVSEMLRFVEIDDEMRQHEMKTIELAKRNGAADFAQFKSGNYSVVNARFPAIANLGQFAEGCTGRRVASHTQTKRGLSQFLSDKTVLGRENL